MGRQQSSKIVKKEVGDNILKRVDIGVNSVSVICDMIDKPGRVKRKIK